MMTGLDLKITPDPDLEHLTPICAYCVPVAELQHLSLVGRYTFGICDACQQRYDRLAAVLYPLQQPKDRSK